MQNGLYGCHYRLSKPNKAHNLKKVVRLVSGVGAIGLEPMTSSM